MPSPDSPARTVPSGDPGPRVRIEIPWGTIFRVLTAVLLVWLWFRLWQWILLLIISAFLAFNALYNTVETYYITPKVYGNQLRLSSLAVILAFAIGGELGGVIGALVALPIAAMYPTIERIWLADRLAPEVVADHRRIEKSEEH